MKKSLILLLFAAIAPGLPHDGPAPVTPKATIDVVGQSADHRTIVLDCSASVGLPNVGFAWRPVPADAKVDIKEYTRKDDTRWSTLVRCTAPGPGFWQVGVGVVGGPDDKGQPVYTWAIQGWIVPTPPGPKPVPTPIPIPPRPTPTPPPVPVPTPPYPRPTPLPDPDPGPGPTPRTPAVGGPYGLDEFIRVHVSKMDPAVVGRSAATFARVFGEMHDKASTYHRAQTFVTVTGAKLRTALGADHAAWDAAVLAPLRAELARLNATGAIRTAGDDGVTDHATAWLEIARGVPPQ